MNFTYDAYRQLINLLRKNDYAICSYLDYNKHKKAAILRHDIDMDLPKAAELARVECELQVQATYYVLISSDFYNIFSKKNHGLICNIQEMGHTIGLHFDEERYRGVIMFWMRLKGKLIYLNPI